MSEPKFTPGTWRVVHRRNHEYWILNDKDLCIATVYDAPPTFHIDGKANAALVAAAPDLYKALKALSDLNKYFIKCDSGRGMQPCSELTDALKLSDAALASGREELVFVREEK